MNKSNLLLITDFSYIAKGRDYGREDMELSTLLRKYFNVAITHIDNAEPFLKTADAILLRNTGPQSTHKTALHDLQKRDLPLFNNLKGKGDIIGKYHLLKLFEDGYPVIPSYSAAAQIPCNNLSDRFLLKPLDGADSIGVKLLSYSELMQEPIQNMVIQPLTDFEFEVSFYFIADEFQYALYAPNTKKRWELKPYNANKNEIAFAEQFILWNSSERGIQRVDACKTPDGKLLLMELEDYNPFLSIDLLENDVKNKFVDNLSRNINNTIKK